MTLILAIVALVCFIISFFDARVPWVSIGGVLLSLAFILDGGSIDLDAD